MGMYVEINAEQIGRRSAALMLDWLDKQGEGIKADSYRSALRMGMLPAPFMEMMDRGLDLKLEEVGLRDSRMVNQTKQTIAAWMLKELDDRGLLLV